MKFFVFLTFRLNTRLWQQYLFLFLILAEVEEPTNAKEGW